MSLYPNPDPRAPGPYQIHFSVACQTKHISGNMIFLILILTRLPNIAVTDDYPDFFAVKRNVNGRYTGYKIFTRVEDCAVYISGDNRVLFQEKGTWKIANLIGSHARDCQSILNSVRVLNVFPQVALKGPTKITIKRENVFHSSFEIMSLPRCKEIEGLKLSTAFKVFSARDKKDCLNEDHWGLNFPNQNIITSFSHSRSFAQCKYEVDERVTLVEDIRATLFIHSSCDQKTGSDVTEEKIKTRMEIGSDAMEEKIKTRIEIGSDAMEEKIKTRMEIGSDAIEEKIKTRMEIGSDTIEEKIKTRMDTESDVMREKINTRMLPSTVSKTTTTTIMHDPNTSTTTTVSSFSESEDGGFGKSTMIKVSIGAGIAVVLVVGVLVGFFIKRNEKMEKIRLEQKINGTNERYENEIYGPDHYYANDNEAEVKYENNEVEDYYDSM